MLESYRNEIVAKDGSILTQCFRLKKVTPERIRIYDMRLETNGFFTGLNEDRYERFVNGEEEGGHIADVWIAETGEWNVSRTLFVNGNLPINECLKFLGYNAKVS